MCDPERIRTGQRSVNSSRTIVEFNKSTIRRWHHLQEEQLNKVTLRTYAALRVVHIPSFKSDLRNVALLSKASRVFLFCEKRIFSRHVSLPHPAAFCQAFFDFYLLPNFFFVRSPLFFSNWLVERLTWCNPVFFHKRRSSFSSGRLHLCWQKVSACLVLQDEELASILLQSHMSLTVPCRIST